jgi:hypothetical protein
MTKQLIFSALISIFALTLMSPSCEKSTEPSTASPTVDEASTPIAAPRIEPISYTFDDNYKDLWLKVDSLQEIGLYTSAIEVVHVIFEAARKEENTPQVVKAVMHKMKYNAYLEDDDFVLAMNELNQLSAEATFPLKQIIHSVTAESYWGYYQANRWTFLNRTQTVNFENDDVRTWDLNTLLSHVKKNYLLSLSGRDSLQVTSITDFTAILSQSSVNSPEQRPSLYDFLAHRALIYFQNSEQSLNRPEEKFSLESRNYFGNPAEFLALQINSNDTLSGLLEAVHIYRELTRFHVGDKDPSALIDLNLKRLKFARSHSIKDNKDELYLKALTSLADKHKLHPSSAEVNHQIARYYNQQGNKYSAKDKETQWDKKKAFGYCKIAMLNHPKSLGAGQCEALMVSIQQKNISFKTEVAYAPTSNAKMLITYKNVDLLYFKMVKVDWDYFYKQSLYGEDLMEELLKLESVHQWKNKIENPGDYQQHTTEIVLPKTALGQYIVLASPNEDFKLEKNAIAHGSYWSSNLSYTYRRKSDQTIEAYVTDRETGLAQKNVKATVLVRKYNYVTRKYEARKQESYRTDEFGMFTIKSSSDYRNIYVDLQLGNDQYNNSNQIYQSRDYSQTTSNTTTHLFTDRAIYRPGQTIYFKGIKIFHQGDKHTLVINRKSSVDLMDANYQKVASLDVTTNEYGTFSGSFTAPSGGMNGQMHLKEINGTKYFSVEEYKRPKFEVKFEPIKGVYKIGEKIKVTGTAKAYAGSNIDGADVQYRITRSCSFNYWTRYRWGYYPHSQTTEIKHGDVKTDENGEFIIEFVAKEDPTINKKYFPNYNYSISTDVTDLNGETRSASNGVRVGYNCMNLRIGMSSLLDRSDKNRFKVFTTNLNGEKIEASGSIKVTKLIEPNRLYRTSLWESPDMQSFSKEEYNTFFPHDEFDGEYDHTKYKKGGIVGEFSFDTAKKDSIDFTGMNSWEPGRYIVESTSIDAFGQKVEEIKYITVNDKNSTKNPTNDIWSFTPLKTSCEPGENAEFLISSGADKLFVLYEIEHKGKIVKRAFITLGKSQKKLSIPILEKHRGNITVHFSTVKYGRHHSARHAVTVPYSNKVLDIEFETFRNKLLPGSKEEWKLKIKGPRGEKVAAELMAAMYDASLDAFAANSFYMNVYNSYYSSLYWGSSSFDHTNSSLYNDHWNEYKSTPSRQYNGLNWWGANPSSSYLGYRNNRGRIGMEGSPLMDYAVEESEVYGNAVPAPMVVAGTLNSTATTTTQENLSFNALDSGDDEGLTSDIQLQQEGKNSQEKLTDIKARSNLNETAFFYPQMETNSEGDIVLKFTIPEALTKWKFLGMAHTKDLKIGYIQEEVVTQKELMVMPNPPRFFREGDKMTFTAKVSNLTEEDMDGTAQLLLFDALSMKPIDALFKNPSKPISFNAKKGQSAKLAWAIEIPEGVGAVTYRVVAQAGKYSDGEEMAIPILSNRMLVTESMPLPSKGIGTKDFTFTKLLNSAGSSSLKHHKLTLEYTSNPAWYAIQAMPYMMEYPYECAEQTFTRYYSNALASSIVNSNPKIKNVFESWKQSSPDAFLSNLEKNQELKSLMLEETPWVLDAQNEGERKKRVALLFDLNKMDNELGKAMRKLQKMQVSNGGWPWFPGMEESRYITQHIVTGLGHLDHLGVKTIREDQPTWRMVQNGVKYLDDRVLEDYEWLKKHDSDYLTEQHISQLQVQYLYARSYFKDVPMNKPLQEAFDYYQDQAKTYWTKFNLYNEGMIALQAKRYGVEDLPEMVMASIKERAIIHDELGMYWKDNVGGYYWYQAPIETQALLIEAFDEVTNDEDAVEEAKVWLLKQKQTTDWKTTKATAEACYALLLRGTDILMNDEQVDISVNNVLIDPVKLGSKVEAGTGYFKTSWGPSEIVPEMGNVSVTRKTKGVSWGAMYWQYFEDLDKITPHETPLKLEKKLFLVVQTDAGPVITPLKDGTKLKPGDKVRVRIELRTDRNMEYVHMKDMRAAGFEPVNVFSRYKWQGGLGYYESTKDAATNFFMDYLPKGTYVFEYDLRVSHEGDFSNGITTIQSMYAPEFTSHSEGVRVSVGAE